VNLSNEYIPNQRKSHLDEEYIELLDCNERYVFAYALAADAAISCGCIYTVGSAKRSTHG